MDESYLNKYRIVGLDWLRGLCALSIMFYHYGGGADITNFLNINSTLQKLGIYGVSIFFILSGLSIAIVYHKFITNIKSSFFFILRRIFRIVPLHFIICLLITTSLFYKNEYFDLYKFLLNATLLFGFFNPSEYIVVGAWSIGNEMVYYLFTPLILYIFNCNRKAGNIIYAISIIIGAYFAFFALDSKLSLAEQWSVYINPFNNFFLYITGIAIYYNFSNINFSLKINYSILILALFIFISLPLKGDQISICTGVYRFIYCSLSSFIVLSFYKMKITKLTFAGKLFEQFGIATYGVYLLHPIVLSYLSFINSGIIRLPIAMILTIVIALISYYLFESKLTKMGKRFTTLKS